MVTIYCSMDDGQFVNFDSITINITITRLAKKRDQILANNWNKIVVMMILNFNTVEKLRSYLSYKSIKFN